jgi:hypothetical protein
MDPAAPAAPAPELPPGAPSRRGRYGAQGAAAGIVPPPPGYAPEFGNPYAQPAELYPPIDPALGYTTPPPLQAYPDLGAMQLGARQAAYPSGPMNGPMDDGRARETADNPQATLLDLLRRRRRI